MTYSLKNDKICQINKNLFTMSNNLDFLKDIWKNAKKNDTKKCQKLNVK